VRFAILVSGGTIEMPTYEYACKKCDEHVEVVQSFKDEPLTECPSCGGTLRKVFSPVGIVLKGSGFYKTDSRAAGGSKGPKKESTSEKSESKSESKSDSKTESKTETKGSKDTKSQSKSA
jgi:putative FmdB family regulatory protein